MRLICSCHFLSKHLIDWNRLNQIKYLELQCHCGQFWIWKKCKIDYWYWHFFGFEEEMNYQNQSFENRISSDGFDFRNDKSDILMHKLKSCFLQFYVYYKILQFPWLQAFVWKIWKIFCKKKVMKKPCPTWPKNQKPKLLGTIIALYWFKMACYTCDSEVATIIQILHNCVKNPHNRCFFSRQLFTF